jgi:hypothetical protein
MVLRRLGYLLSTLLAAGVLTDGCAPERAAGFIFPEAGCWRVHAWRDGSSGHVFFQIVGD